MSQLGNREPSQALEWDLEAAPCLCSGIDLALTNGKGLLMYVKTAILVLLFMVTKVNAVTLHYTTDWEGDWRRAESFLKSSTGILWDGRHFHFKNMDGEIPRDIFIYGGDAVDRGPDSRKIVRALVDFKKKFPKHVIIILGNRDLNKIEIPMKLHGLTGKAAVEALKELLSKEFAAPNAFEFHTREWMKDLEALRQERNGNAAASLLPVDWSPETLDHLVKDLYLSDLKNGVFRELLELGQVYFEFRDSVVVHGSIRPESYGYVPDHPLIEGLSPWGSALNSWKDAQIKSWAAEFTAGIAKPGGAGQALIDYQKKLPGLKHNNMSTVYGRFSNDQIEERIQSVPMLQNFIKQGRRRILVGHTAMGRFPMFMTYGKDFEIIQADTSHSPNYLTTSIEIEYSGESLHGRTRVIFHNDEQKLDFYLDENPLVGKILSDGRHIRGVHDGKLFLIRTGLNNPFKMEDEIVDIASLPQDIKVGDPVDPLSCPLLLRDFLK